MLGNVTVTSRTIRAHVMRMRGGTAVVRASPLKIRERLFTDGTHAKNIVSFPAHGSSVPRCHRPRFQYVLWSSVRRTRRTWCRLISSAPLRCPAQICKARTIGGRTGATRGYGRRREDVPSAENRGGAESGGVEERARVNVVDNGHRGLRCFQSLNVSEDSRSLSWLFFLLYTAYIYVYVFCRRVCNSS